MPRAPGRGSANRRRSARRLHRPASYATSSLLRDVSTSSGIRIVAATDYKSPDPRSCRGSPSRSWRTCSFASSRSAWTAPMSGQGSSNSRRRTQAGRPRRRSSTERARWLRSRRARRPCSTAPSRSRRGRARAWSAKASIRLAHLGARAGVDARREPGAGVPRRRDLPRRDRDERRRGDAGPDRAARRGGAGDRVVVSSDSSLVVHPVELAYERDIGYLPRTFGPKVEERFGRALRVALTRDNVFRRFGRERRRA